VIDAYPDGAWFAEFAALDDPALVPETVASALRVKPHADGPLHALAAALAEQHALLIFDNCEHVLDAVVSLTDTLLRRCPEVRILTTSREALGMAGESLMPVPSMSLPEMPATATPEQLDRLSASDAVRLFVDRGRAVDPAFRLTGENAEAVVQVCRRLDGIPLAIELAAARLRSLPPAQIAARLDQRFRLLTGGSRTALPRHRTLRAAMDWSIDLLPEAERVLVPRLATFSGSFSLEAAEAVASGGPVNADEMIDLLAHLIDKSLLMPEPTPTEARYRMLETIRDYAQERLAESDEAAEMHARHRDWFVSLVEQARPGFFSGAEQAGWLTRLSDELDNLRAALQWSHDDPDGASAELSLASGLWRFWEIRGHLAEGSAWLGKALERSGGEVSARRASALTGAGVLASHRGDHRAAVAFHEASLLVHRELGDALSIAAACNNVASIAIELGDVDRARALYLEGIAAAEAAGDQRGAAFTCVNLADVIARHADSAEADALYARAVSIFESLGDTWGIAQTTARLAQAARRRGNSTLARQHFGEARDLYRTIADGRGEARMLIGLGDVASEDDDASAAGAHYREALALRHALGDRVGMAGAIERLAGISTDRPERAAELVGAALAVRETTGAGLTAAARAELDQFLAGLEASIGSDALRTALAIGRGKSLPEILELALA
jgi:predicted ATPase